ncbi:hypothetical protein SGLAM104S_09757 [Streptomyces glaucescens]
MPSGRVTTSSSGAFFPPVWEKRWASASFASWAGLSGSRDSKVSLSIVLPDMAPPARVSTTHTRATVHR